MMNRIAVPFLAMSLLATSAFAADPSPKPSPAAHPEKVAASPKPAVTPAKSASMRKPHTVAQRHRERRVAAGTATDTSNALQAGTPKTGAAKTQMTKTSAVTTEAVKAGAVKNGTVKTAAAKTGTAKVPSPASSTLDTTAKPTIAK
jgi:hypothetical protein